MSNLKPHIGAKMKGNPNTAVNLTGIIARVLSLKYYHGLSAISPLAIIYPFKIGLSEATTTGHPNAQKLTY